MVFGWSSESSALRFVPVTPVGDGECDGDRFRLMALFFKAEPECGGGVNNRDTDDEGIVSGVPERLRLLLAASSERNRTARLVAELASA